MALGHFSSSGTAAAEDYHHHHTHDHNGKEVLQYDAEKSHDSSPPGELKSEQEIAAAYGINEAKLVRKL